MHLWKFPGCSLMGCGGQSPGFGAWLLELVPVKRTPKNDMELTFCCPWRRWIGARSMEKLREKGFEWKPEEAGTDSLTSPAMVQSQGGWQCQT